MSRGGDEKGGKREKMGRGVRLREMLARVSRMSSWGAVLSMRNPFRLSTNGNNVDEFSP